VRVLSDADRAALLRLPDRTARLIVQRWLELTSLDTHPEWRLHGVPEPGSTGVVGLCEDYARGRSDRAYHTTEAAATDLLARGGIGQWQHNAARTHLLDRSGRNERAGIPFAERLASLDSLELRTSRRARPQLFWDAAPPIANQMRLPWTTSVALSHHATAPDVDLPVRVNPRRHSGGRWMSVNGLASEDSPLAISRAASRLREEGTIMLDILRLATRGADLSTGRRVEVTRSRRMNGVPLAAMPRLQQRRVIDVLRPLADEYGGGGQPSPSVQRSVSGIRWLATALSRWHESPSFAAALTWMSIEAMFGKCTWSHRPNCKRVGQPGHMSATELYVATLPDRLGLEIEDYLLGAAGTWKGGRVPAWMLETPLRRRGSRSRWLKRLLTEMDTEQDGDPLLRFHCVEALKLRGRKLDQVGQRCAEDLRELQQARNAVVHEGSVFLQEERSTYLAALAAEIALLALEHREDALAGRRSKVSARTGRSARPGRGGAGRSSRSARGGA
jgi:hypothetical protein